jgi:4-amino-4-deoxy-L-arabinose transferase-like glycosyltransferase
MAALVAVVAALLVGAFTWSGTVFNGDEATYALFARALREGGDWLHLRLGGEILHQRPPLYPWLLALSTSIFGENAFAWRLPSVLAGAGTAAFVFLLARRVMPVAAAVTAGLLHPTLALVFRYDRAVVSDAVLTFFCVAAIHCWLDAPKEKRAALWAGLALGGALMTKQIVGFLPLLVPAVQLLGTERRLVLRRALTVLGVALVVCLPWHVAMFALHGQAFVDGYLGFNVIDRAARTLLPPTTFTYYFEVLWQQEGVVLVFASMGVALSLAHYTRTREAVWLLIPLWLGGVVGAFTLASSRIDYYLVPAMPAVALAAAVPIAWVEKPKLMAIGGATLVVTSLALHVPQRITDVRKNPEIAALSEHARVAAPPDVPLVVVDDLPFVPELYSRRKVILVVSSRAHHDRIAGIDLFAVPGNLRHVTLPGLAAFLEGEGQYLVIEAKKSVAEHELPADAKILASVPGYLLYGHWQP